MINCSLRWNTKFGSSHYVVKFWHKKVWKFNPILYLVHSTWNHRRWNFKEFTLPEKVTISMEQSPLWETNRSANDQVFPHALWDPEVNIHAPYRPIVLPIPRNINSLHSTIHFIQDIFKIIFSLFVISRFSKNISVHFITLHMQTPWHTEANKIMHIKGSRHFEQ